MSCLNCKVDYLMDKANVNEACVRRMTNRMDCSPSSAEVSDVKRTNAYEFREFEARWKGGRPCTHANELDTASDFVPEATAKEEIAEPVRSMGVEAMTSRASATHGVGGRQAQGTRSGRTQSKRR